MVDAVSVAADGSTAVCNVPRLGANTSLFAGNYFLEMSLDGGATYTSNFGSVRVDTVAGNCSGGTAIEPTQDQAAKIAAADSARINALTVALLVILALLAVLVVGLKYSGLDHKDADYMVAAHTHTHG